MRWYLVLWAALTTTAAGAVIWLAIDGLVEARWAAALRPRVERLTRALVPLAIAFVPLAVLARDVWPWVDPPPALAAAIAAKRAWLSWPWFVVRSALYLAVLVAAGWQLRRARRRRAASAAWLFPAALATAFGAIDWLMTLDPQFTSAAFGAYVLAGGVTAALAATALVERRPAPELARVLLVCVLAWSYFAYTQALVIGIADRPDEIAFYARRSHALALAVAALHGALPTLLLAPRALIARPRYLAGVAALLLAAHALDLAWLVTP